MPILDKIQNYIKSLKCKLGINLADISNFVDKNQFPEDYDDESIFCFGSKFVNGSDDDHFQHG